VELGDSLLRCDDDVVLTRVVLVEDAIQDVVRVIRPTRVP